MEGILSPNKDSIAMGSVVFGAWKFLIIVYMMMMRYYEYYHEFQETIRLVYLSPNKQKKKNLSNLLQAKYKLYLN